ncbi:AMP-binding protein [Streptomyces mirabilis]|uniref:AMP-binding protein n=1 Tax=Streptomyces mirabilis TaxID=68239 RepID=UPI002E243A7C
MACTAPTPKAVLSGDDVAALPYSSGTTGLSKGVMLTRFVCPSGSLGQRKRTMRCLCM